jgi:hypothetical protein
MLYVPASINKRVRISDNKKKRVNQKTLVCVNQHRHHQPRRDILILFVARLSSRLSRHTTLCR